MTVVACIVCTVSWPYHSPSYSTVGWPHHSPWDNKVVFLLVKLQNQLTTSAITALRNIKSKNLSPKIDGWTVQSSPMIGPLWGSGVLWLVNTWYGHRCHCQDCDWRCSWSSHQCCLNTDWLLTSFLCSLQLAPFCPVIGQLSMVESSDWSAAYLQLHDCCL